MSLRSDLEKYDEAEEIFRGICYVYLKDVKMDELLPVSNIDDGLLAAARWCADMLVRMESLDRATALYEWILDAYAAKGFKIPKTFNRDTGFNLEGMLCDCSGWNVFCVSYELESSTRLYCARGPKSFYADILAIYWAWEIY
jgi:hypothetical protein